MFRKKPSIPCLLFISCLCSGLGSSVDCCCKIYHPELGSSELTNVGHDWKTCDTCVLMDTAYLPQDSGISAGKLKAGTESAAQPWSQPRLALLSYVAGFWCGLLAGTWAEWQARIPPCGLCVPAGASSQRGDGVQWGSVPRKRCLLLWFNRGSHMGSLMP